jgi:hypothetical protein
MALKVPPLRPLLLHDDGAQGAAVVQYDVQYGKWVFRLNADPPTRTVPVQRCVSSLSPPRPPRAQEQYGSLGDAEALVSPESRDFSVALAGLSTIDEQVQRHRPRRARVSAGAERWGAARRGMSGGPAVGCEERIPPATRR